MVKCYLQQCSKNVLDFRATRFVQRAINDILYQIGTSDTYPSVFELAPNSILHICTNPCSDDCENFTILTRQTNRTMCEKCTYQIMKEGKQEQRKSSDVGKRGDSSSRVNNRYMSPGSSAKKNKERKMDIKNLKRTVIRLQQLELKQAKEEQMVSIEDPETLNFLHKAFEHATAPVHRIELKKKIVEVLLSAGNKLRDVDKTEVEIFTTRVCNLLDAQAKQMSKHNKQQLMILV